MRPHLRTYITLLSSSDGPAFAHLCAFQGNFDYDHATASWIYIALTCDRRSRNVAAAPAFDGHFLYYRIFKKMLLDECFHRSLSLLPYGLSN